MNQKYSNFSILGICFDAQCKREKKIAELKKQCEASQDNQDAIDACILSGTQDIDEQIALEQSQSSGSSTASMSVEQLLAWAGITKPPASAPPTYQPPAPQNNLILGLSPTAAIVGGLVVAGVVTTVIVLALKGKKAA